MTTPNDTTEKEDSNTDLQRIEAASEAAGETRRKLEYIEDQIDKFANGLIAAKNQAWEKVR